MFCTLKALHAQSPYITCRDHLQALWPLTLHTPFQSVFPAGPHPPILPPCYHTTQQCHQSPCFLFSTVPAATPENCPITPWPNPSFNNVQTVQGPHAPCNKGPSLWFVLSSQCFYTKADPAGFMWVQWTRCMQVWIYIEVLSLSSFSSETLTSFSFFFFFGLFVTACWESLDEANHVPGKAYGTAGMQTPAVGPLCTCWESFQTH